MATTKKTKKKKKLKYIVLKIITILITRQKWRSGGIFKLRHDPFEKKHIRCEKIYKRINVIGDILKNSKSTTFLCSHIIAISSYQL